MSARTGVLYVVGKGRSGSTLIDVILGQVDGCVAVGELWQFWRTALSEHQLCGCGDPVGSCAKWQAVAARLRGSGIDFVEAERARKSAQSWTEALVSMAARYGTGSSRAQRYAGFQASLYAAVAEAFGARIIVDSSKWPADPVLRGLVDNVEPYALHLVRDPRAVAYSWQRTKRQVDRAAAEPMPKHTSGQSALSWLGRNVIADVITARMPPGHFLRIRYEDLVSDPRRMLNDIDAMIGLDGAEKLFIGSKRLRVGETHTVAGNPDRLHTGVVQLRLDDEWKEYLSSYRSWLTTLITRPLLRRYGYPTVHRLGQS